VSDKKGRIGILVGGGPAPGINSVIAASTIRSILKGYEVIGIHGGFRWIMRGDVSQTNLLTIETVSRIHFRGGSLLGAARDNPTKNEADLDRTVAALRRLGIDKLITIGGDDTAFSAMSVEARSQGKISVVHVPKTIDNDLDLPNGVDTFGYQTARHVGVKMLKNLMIDARTTGRWYLVISMGRKAGHLALGTGKAAGATVTIIPEEFDGDNIHLSHVADIIVGTMIKRMSQNRMDGVAVLAEGLMERMNPDELAEMGDIQHDAHGHVQLGEFQFAPFIRRKVKERLREFNINITITAKDIGYELRGAEPVPKDMEYTRDLGFCAAQFIINGGNAAMVCIEHGRFKPIYFKDMLDERTGRTRVRMVQLDSEYYHIARRYMLRLNKTDFESEHLIATYAAAANISTSKFRKEFGYLVEDDLLNKIRDRKRKGPASVEDVMTPF
jgi:6-phosphofructokinase 1